MITRAVIVVAMAALVAAFLVEPGSANDVTVKDGDTITVDGKTCRLDAIDAPELDQVCLNEAGATMPCGREARVRLAQYIGARAVRCDDNGPDPVFRRRRICVCTVEGETMSINQWLVRQGVAIDFEPFAHGRYQSDENDARQNRRGLWSGCFVAPQHLRYWRKPVAPLLGSACSNEPNARDKLFPDNPEMPPGCSIKGKFAVRAKVTGYRGIYHLEGCSSYRTLKNPNRWFCSEEDAQAAGFRKALTCRGSRAG
jgi:endonuclease YncB( thermonuclease family)